MFPKIHCKFWFDDPKRSVHPSVFPPLNITINVVQQQQTPNLNVPLTSFFFVQRGNHEKTEERKSDQNNKFHKKFILRS